MWKWVAGFWVLGLLCVALWLWGPRIGFASIAARAIVTVLVVGPVVAFVLWRRVQAVGGARSIERALNLEAQEAAAQVAPDRRQEIDVLTQEFQKALRALKSSRLGRSRGRGTTALYALPWYMIVGPPATGKSTALLASGLNFPYTPAHGKGLRGVGGTRNCDWWFTDEAILLDTAGRYMTEDDDRKEWLAFLGLLRKHRPKKPLNGVMVAVAVTDLLDADLDQVDQMAEKLRSRIDEIMGKLDHKIPAYVLLTKCDLLPGFVEFFADLRKPERGQLLGFTLPLDESRDPKTAFEDEFDLLAQALRERMNARLGDEPKAEERERIFQFPLELAAARENVAHFLQQLFQRNPYQEAPLFRGVYLTSGTQQGRPIDRVMSAMGRAFGIEAGTADRRDEQRIERRSYFLRDLFVRVIFPDQDVAARSGSGQHRTDRVRRAAFAGTAGVAGLLVASGLWAYRGNVGMAAETASLAQTAGQVPWQEKDRTGEDFEKLERLRARLTELETWSNQGPPLHLGLGMYAGQALLAPARAAYRALLEPIFLGPVHRELELRLAEIATRREGGSDAHRRGVETLKAYLMLSEPGRIDREPLARVLLEIWRGTLRAQRSLPSDAMLAPHVGTVVSELAQGGLAPLVRDDRLVAEARSALARLPEEEALLDQILAEGAAHLRPLELRDMVGNVLVPIMAAGPVPGVFTRAGWEQLVRRALGEARGQLDRDAWVLGGDASAGQDAGRDVLRRLYFERYADSWKRFLRGLQVRPTETPRDALRDIETLTQESSPYLKLFKEVVYQTSVPAEQPLRERALGAAEAAKDKLTGGAAADAAKIMPPLDTEFARLREFVGAPAAGAASGAPRGEAPLAQYLAALGKVRDALKGAVEGGDSQRASDETRAADELVQRLLLETLDDGTRPLLAALLSQPLANAKGSAVAGMAQALQHAWEAEVFAPYQRGIANRYPFAKKASGEATLADATDFFREGGILWNHYQQKLARFVTKTGDEFHPQGTFEHLFSGAFLRCLHDASVWSSELFPPGAQTPLFAFDVRPQPVGRGVSEVALEIDGQPRTYRNGPDEHWLFTWPGGGKSHGVRLSIRGAAGLADTLSFAGDWGLFHFLDAAKTVRASGDVHLLAWTLGSGTQVTLEVRPARAANPMAERPVLACPKGVR